MYNGLLHLHNVGRWVLLILLLACIFRSLKGMSSDKPYSAGDKKWGLFLMITAHSMLLLGLYQWFSGPWGYQNISNLGMKTVMQDGVSRFWAIEHMIGMIIGIILITIGRSSGKMQISDNAKHSRSFWFYFTALIIIVLFIPWPFREVARPIFPGM